MLNQALGFLTDSAKPDNLQTHRFQQLLPLCVRPFHAGKRLDIEEGRDEGTAGIGQDPVVDQDRGIARVYGSDGVTEELVTFCVGPVEAD